MWIAIQAVTSENGFSVEVQNPEDQRRYWVDINIDEKYKDVEADWNQYIFDLTSEEDLIRKATQENNDNFDEAVSVAICYLESLEFIYQDDKANWYKK